MFADPIRTLFVGFSLDLTLYEVKNDMKIEVHFSSVASFNYKVKLYILYSHSVILTQVRTGNSTRLLID